jgi:hypothetical protein
MRFPGISKAVLAVIVIGVAIGSVTKAYVTYSSWGTLNVPVYVNPANLDVSASAAISAVQAGMNAWSTQTGTGFRFSYAGQTSTANAGDDGRNVVLFRNATNGGTIASTYVWTSGGLIRDADVVFWDGAWKFFTGTSGCASGAYIEDIATHELGHALGLQHSSVADATMNANSPSCSTWMRTLASDDIAGARALYQNGPGVADTPPTVRILTPANGATASSSTTINFSGSATDTTDGDISRNLVWKSNISGQIGTGASFSRTLPTGTHTISATVRDSIGYTITQAIIVTVSTGGGGSNTAPTVTIGSPLNGVSVSVGSAVTFTGSANDAQQGNLSSSLVWRSNLEGQIGTGATFSRSLGTGVHTVTATVTDSGGLTTQAGILVTVVALANTAPAITIASPSNGITVTVGSTVTFTGSANDAQQGNLSSSLVWRSNLDGQIGTGSTFNRSLTTGIHTITATATDSGGLTGQAGISVTVAAVANTVPVVTIASPANGASVVAGTSVVFSGSATDTQQGNLTNSLVWRSNIDGQIGTGGSFTRSLTAGTHTITASVVDNGNLTGQRSITVSAATAAPPPASATLTARGYAVGPIYMVDLAWNGLSGANVDVYRNNLKVTTTPNDGAMTHTIGTTGGSHTYRVCAAGTATCTNDRTVSF